MLSGVVSVSTEMINSKQEVEDVSKTTKLNIILTPGVF